MEKKTIILTPEDYAEYVRLHPETIKRGNVNYYGLRIVESKPSTENRAMRRQKKKKQGRG